jgi:hypothetical protein
MLAERSVLTGSPDRSLTFKGLGSEFLDRCLISGLAAAGVREVCRLPGSQIPNRAPEYWTASHGRSRPRSGPRPPE